MRHHAAIEELLDKCLQEILAGRWSVDDCLCRNPQAASQLAPLLRAALSLCNTPRPSPLSVEMRHALERQLLLETRRLARRNRADRLSACAR